VRRPRAGGLPAAVRVAPPTHPVLVAVLARQTFFHAVHAVLGVDARVAGAGTLRPKTTSGLSSVFSAYGQDYRIGTARKISVDIDATPDLLLLIQQKLHIVQYRYGSLSRVCFYSAHHQRKSLVCSVR